MQYLKLYRPLVTNKITQTFGESKACVDYRGKVIGMRGSVCPPGTYSFYESLGMKGHNGIDFNAWHGEYVFHAGLYKGRMKIEKDAQGGIGVDVISLEPVQLNDGRQVYVKTRYWHLKSVVGHDGKIVELGDIIGLADNTGASSGDHLHFGIKVCDKNGNALEPNNGYTGAFDPTPYMNNKVDAKTSAGYLNIQSLPLTKQEQKEINSQLSKVRQLLLAFKANLTKI